MNMLLVLITFSASGFISLIMYYFFLKKKSKRLRYIPAQKDHYYFRNLPDANLVTRTGISYFLAPLAALNRAILPKSMLKSQEDELLVAELNLRPEDVFAIKELFGLAFLGLGIILVKGLPFSEFWVILLLGIGLFVPSYYIKSKIRKRKLAIIRSLPHVVDLLTLAVGAGLDFMVGMKWIVDKTNIKDNAMVREIAICLREIRLGRSRRDSLRDMAKRLNIPEVTSFARTLVQSDRMGTSVEDSFKILSEDTRRRRFERGERLALQAPLKMLIPLIICILPTVLIIVAGPVLLQFLQSGFNF